YTSEEKAGATVTENPRILKQEKNLTEEPQTMLTRHAVTRKQKESVRQQELQTRSQKAKQFPYSWERLKCCHAPPLQHPLSKLQQAQHV
ncbi:hypothetical protein NDU88_007300, partial [Pleurodeles waltl]